MRIFKFDTKVSSNGTIQIPYTPYLFDKEVEIIILPKNNKEDRPNAAKNFIEKWSGFLINKNTDLSKSDYLNDKYK